MTMVVEAMHVVMVMMMTMVLMMMIMVLMRMVVMMNDEDYCGGDVHDDVRWH